MRLMQLLDSHRVKLQPRLPGSQFRPPRPGPGVSRQAVELRLPVVGKAGQGQPHPQQGLPLFSPLPCSCAASSQLRPGAGHALGIPWDPPGPTGLPTELWGVASGLGALHGGSRSPDPRAASGLGQGSTSERWGSPGMTKTQRSLKSQDCKLPARAGPAALQRILASLPPPRVKCRFPGRFVPLFVTGASGIQGASRPEGCFSCLPTGTFWTPFPCSVCTHRAQKHAGDCPLSL